VPHDLDRDLRILRVEEGKGEPRDVVAQRDPVGPEAHLPGVALRRVAVSARPLDAPTLPDGERKPVPDTPLEPRRDQLLRRRDTQCPAFTSAATVKNSSLIPAFSPWLKYQPCSPGKRGLGSDALVACSSCRSTMTMEGWKPISSGYSIAPAPSKAFFLKLQSLIQIFHSSPERS